MYDVYEIRSKKLLEVLHEIKHMNVPEVHALLDANFPHWHSVEFYSPTRTAKTYLISTVLNTRVHKQKKSAPKPLNTESP